MKFHIQPKFCFYSLIDKKKCHYSLIDKGAAAPSYTTQTALIHGISGCESFDLQQMATVLNAYPNLFARKTKMLPFGEWTWCRAQLWRGSWFSVSPDWYMELLTRAIYHTGTVTMKFYETRQCRQISFITRGQFWPSGIVIACVCGSVCPCVSVYVYQSRACPHDNSSPIQARITKLGPEMQNILV